MSFRDFHLFPPPGTSGVEYCEENERKKAHQAATPEENDIIIVYFSVYRCTTSIYINFLYSLSSLRSSFFLSFSFLCFFNLFSVYIYIFIYKFLQGVFSVFVSISLLLIDVVAQRHFLKPTSFHGNSTFHSLDGLYIGVFSLHSMSLFLAVLGVALSTNIDRCFPTTIESTYNTALNV